MQRAHGLRLRVPRSRIFEQFIVVRNPLVDEGGSSAARGAEEAAEHASAGTSNGSKGADERQCLGFGAHTAAIPGEEGVCARERGDHALGLLEDDAGGRLVRAEEGVQEAARREEGRGGAGEGRGRAVRAGEGELVR
jgi:hypothetical protein